VVHGSPEIGDFNGDGIPDAVVSAFGRFVRRPSELGTLFLAGKGDGTFAKPQLVCIFCGVGGAADVNGDGHLDLLGWPLYPFAFLGDGAGHFRPAGRRHVLNSFSWPIAAADMTSDGNLDLVTPGLVAPGDGTGRFPAKRVVSFATRTNAQDFTRDVAVADFNRDGLSDVAVTTARTHRLSVLLGARLKPGRCANPKTPVVTDLPGGTPGSITDGTPFGDVIHGTPGPDWIYGRAGDDCLYGGRGDDRLYGGPGHDRIWGGSGDDRIYARDGTRDWIDCGPGRDTVWADPVDIVRHCEVVHVR
jgi:Ca2+-binding RTX toxin-like protein